MAHLYFKSAHMCPGDFPCWYHAGREQNRFCNIRWKAVGSPPALQSHCLALSCCSPVGSVPWSPMSAEASAAPPSLQSPGSVTPAPLAATVSHPHQLCKTGELHKADWPCANRSVCKETLQTSNASNILHRKQKWWFNMKVVIKIVFMLRLNFSKKVLQFYVNFYGSPSAFF